MTSFEEQFGRPCELHADAPGRVNLIGEHTDYNGGYVLPIATEQRTQVELARGRDDAVRVFSEERGTAHYRLGEERRTGEWIDYVAGVTHALRGLGYPVSGFDVRVSSEVPLGAGLSSSAALEVAIGRALREMFALDLDDLTLAEIGRRAENDFVGVRSGPMDQLAAAFATLTQALLIDCRTLEFERLAMPDGVKVTTVDSGERHSLADADYNLRRQECERAAALLGVRWLCELEPGDRRIATLPGPLDRRARHVVEENARVRELAAALRAGDVASMGAAMNASHDSQRDLFEVSTPGIDRIVERERARGALGARLTGGGFGGSIVVLDRQTG